MVRCGTKIKKRSSVKVARKSKPLRRYNNKYVADPNIREQWNPKLTTKQNYERIGLNADPNSHAELQKLVKQQLKNKGQKDDDGEFFAVPDSDFLSERNPRRKENYMSEEETKYLRRLQRKHQDDYAAMERDIKVNAMQWTAHKLRQRCARLALMDANQLLPAVQANVNVNVDAQ